MLLYECLAGRLPFRGETSIDILHSILREPHAHLRSLLPELSPEWEQLVDRCLVKSVEQRCASMDEILDTLRRTASPALRPEKSLAVLYFANLSGENIARALRVVLTEKERREVEKVPTSEVQAYDYYLRGRQFFHQMRRKSLEFARQMFARAIVIDPGYARAFAGVADCCSYLYMYFDPSEDNLREAVTASRRAVKLDPESAEAHAPCGFAVSLGKNHEEAEREFESAIRLNPQLFEAFWFYGRSCFVRGQHEKAAALFEKAGEVNPDDFQSIIHAGLSHHALGQLEKASKARHAALRRIERHTQTMCAPFIWAHRPFTRRVNATGVSSGSSAPSRWSPMITLCSTTSPAYTLSSEKQTRPLPA